MSLQVAHRNAHRLGFMGRESLDSARSKRDATAEALTLQGHLGNLALNLLEGGSITGLWRPASHHELYLSPEFRVHSSQVRPLTFRHHLRYVAECNPIERKNLAEDFEHDNGEGVNIHPGVVAGRVGFRRHPAARTDIRRLGPEIFLLHLHAGGPKVCHFYVRYVPCSHYWGQKQNVQRLEIPVENLRFVRVEVLACTGHTSDYLSALERHQLDI
eukprot:CAMPEP_0170580218 /NCGR_PEP_ID=MMETSP0224-20130122/6395_1 /TAXON_ID=285029 /ORGANISM="Togula jolla, Strain CCCM 725" /LENGTH=214 /DNA_ID=CAMNT_0010903285 /DNA_START=87 /DNA_END=732 /DNA_ORIENTATION=-